MEASLGKREKVDVFIFLSAYHRKLHLVKQILTMVSLSMGDLLPVINRTFLLNNVDNFQVFQVLVHEWAKLRWGVYEEHGYPGVS